MVEIEAKIKITEKEFKKFVTKFNRPYFFNQENIIYKIPKGFVRIRREKDKKILTLKKSIEGEFNSREEIEFETKSKLSTLKEFLSGLELEETLTFRKRRANIYLNECTISLDILEENDYYIEVEGSPEKIKQNLIELNLDNHLLETKSYFEIICSKE